MADWGVLRWVAAKALGLPPRQTRRIAVERDMPVTMRDGVVLRADRHHASGQSQGPVVLMRSPYGRGALFGMMAGLLAERGLQVVVQSVRGTGGSGGVLDPMRQEQADGVDTLVWVRAQPWFSQQLFTFGGSYLGYVQWAMAGAAPQQIDGMALSMTLSNFRDELLGAGAFTQAGTLTWTQLMQMMRDAGPDQPMQRPKAGSLDHAHGHLPLGTMDRAALGKSVSWWQDWVQHEDPEDPWWRAIDHSAAVSAPTAPATMVAGWNDIFLPFQLRDYLARQAAGRRDWLTIGPWSHAAPGGMIAGLKDAVALFSALSAGREPNTARQRVRLYVQGAGRWREFPSWPPPGSRPLVLHFRAGGALDQSPPTSDEGAARYTFDPADPTPAAHGTEMLVKPKRRDLVRLSQRRDVVGFTGTSLDQDLEVIGPVSVTLSIRSNREHTDFYACLCDVDRSGRPTHVADGYLRLRPGRPAADATGVRRISIECWPTAYRFKRGHRLRLLVASGAHPRYARNRGTGESLAIGTKMVAAEQEILLSAMHGSSLAVLVKLAE
jgi:uncharacterized protein